MVTVAMWTMIIMCTALFDFNEWEPWLGFGAAVGTPLTLLIDGAALGGDGEDDD